MEKEGEEREGGETMDDVIRTAKEVKIFEQILAFFLLSLTSISNQVRRLIRGSSVTSCASSELVPLQEDRSFKDIHIKMCRGVRLPAFMEVHAGWKPKFWTILGHLEQT